MDVGQEVEHRNAFLRERLGKGVVQPGLHHDSDTGEPLFRVLWGGKATLSHREGALRPYIPPPTPNPALTTRRHGSWYARLGRFLARGK